MKMKSVVADATASSGRVCWLMSSAGSSLERVATWPASRTSPSPNTSRPSSPPRWRRCSMPACLRWTGYMTIKGCASLRRMSHWVRLWLWVVLFNRLLSFLRNHVLEIFLWTFIFVCFTGGAEYPPIYMAISKPHRYGNTGDDHTHYNFEYW